MSTTVTHSKRHLDIDADEINADLNGTINTSTTAATQSTSDNSTKVSTTAFVKAQGYITTQSDTQDLSISARTISLTDGGSVVVPAPTWSSVTSKPTTFAPIIGTTSSTAMAGNTTIPSISGLATTGYVDAKTWNGNDITAGTVVSARLDADTAHLSTTQTFSGAKTFSSTLVGTTASFFQDSAAGTNALNLLSVTNGLGVGITFSDNGSPAASSGGQNGYMYYYHADGSSYGSGNAFVLTSSEETTTILADGKLMYKEGIYSKPSSGTGAGTRKDANWDTAYGWGDHELSAQDKTDIGNLSGTNTGDQTTVSGNAGTVTNGVYTTGTQTIGGAKTFSGKVDFQGDAAIEGGSGYGVFKGYTGNDNHFIAVRGVVANSSSLSITGGHQTTFVEHADATNEGWYFKSFTTGTYREVARIDGVGQMYLGGNQVFHTGHEPTYAEIAGTVPTWNQNTTGNAATATTAGKLTENNTIVFGASNVQWTDQSGNGGTGLNGQAPRNPTNQWYHNLIFNHANSSGYYSQIATGLNTSDIYFTRVSGGTAQAWQRIFADDYHPNADTLTTARTIGGVSFNGAADINLPGVNTAGNQNTTGNAGTVTNGVYTTGNQTIAGTKTFSTTIAGSVSGNAGTATALQASVTIASVPFDGTSNISLNNNNITNGAGYTTYTANQAVNTTSNVTFNTITANGALYVDWDGTSSNIYMQDTDQGQRQIHCNSNYIGFLNQSSAWAFGVDDAGNTINWYSSTITGDLTVNGGDIIIGGTGRIQGIDTVTNGTDAANKAYVDTSISNLIGGAPGALDTLNELAAAINDDASYASTLTTALATKLPLAGGTLTGDLTVSGNQVITASSNADVKFSVWSGTTYGIGMTSGVTYGGLNDYAMTFCMNNSASRGWWWGYSGQSKSSGAMSLTMAGHLTLAGNATISGTVSATGGNSTEWNTAYDKTLQWDGSSTALTASTGRTSLGLGSLATLNSVAAGQIDANAVNASELNVSGNGTTSQYLRSDGDGTMSWVTPPDNNTVYTHPTTAGNKHIPTGGSSGQFLKYSSSGTAVWAADNNTTYSVGAGGLTQQNFTTTLKNKLDGIAASANNYSLPFTNNSTNWNTAHGWGDHQSAGYATTTTLNGTDRSYITDSRGAARAPSYYNDRYAQWDFQNAADTGVGGDTWHGLLTVAKWSVYDGSHRQEQLIFSGNDLFRRTASSDSAWGTSKKIWDSGNLASPANLSSVNNFTNYQKITQSEPKMQLVSSTSPSLTAGMHTQVGGQLLGYGTNYPQIQGGTRNTAFAGGFFRIDVRSNNTSQFFTVQKVTSTNTETVLLAVNIGGDLTTTGNITELSDERLKSDVKTVDNALDKVNALRGVTFMKNGKRSLGVIAQEVEKVLPEVVVEGKEYKSVAYGNIVGVLIEAIKEQDLKIERLEGLVELMLKDK